MLIEFSVSNFRSFRERQTLSMVAAPRLRKRENTLPAPTRTETFPDLLRVAAIYGPNAAGKSNFVQALDAVRLIARNEPSALPARLLVWPFRFDTALRDAPSRFEIHFIEEGLRYSMEVAATAQRIVEERLTVYPRGKAQLLYERQRTGETETYKFGDELEGGSDLHETWRKSTAPDVLFLSRAVANSNEELGQLRHPLRWLTRTLHVILGGLTGWQDSVQSLLAEHPSMTDEVVELLKDVDVPVSRIRSELLETADTNSLGFGTTEPRRRTTLTHQTALGMAEFDLSEESEGTKNLIGFWLPWGLFQDAPASSATDVMIVDEFDSSLHPSIVASLVKRHISSKLAKQLIFTTHDTHLMDAKLLRRDQIWMVERDANGATQLFSIHDVKGRGEEDIEKRYFEGRYRGLPVLRAG
jgi:AAA domain, putative AbiEii toxin, Type IV TA system